MFESELNRIETCGVVPVIALDKADDANPLAEALVKGGLPLAEVTFRTAAAEQSIRVMAARGDILVGAGTVLGVDTVKRAVDAGAKFMVSPGFNPKVVGYCVANNIPITPGCITPTDIEMAIDHGLSVVKFFPAEAFGGLKTIKAISAPYAMMRFIPTGGITDKQLGDYLAFKPILAVGGSWFVARELLAAGRFDEITRLTAQAVEIAGAAGGRPR
jgi:2-dehydro-3-deoxyphosphogluconate aldolase / (4S)-4-hydroxy-2-oxoglutarate aldolase